MSSDWFVVCILEVYIVFLVIYLVKILKEDARDLAEQKKYEQNNDSVV